MAALQSLSNVKGWLGAVECSSLFKGMLLANLHLNLIQYAYATVHGIQNI